jgi:hypothetical protein
MVDRVGVLDVHSFSARSTVSTMTLRHIPVKIVLSVQVYCAEATYAIPYLSEAPALHTNHVFIEFVCRYHEHPCFLHRPLCRTPIKSFQINLQPQALLNIPPHDFLIFIPPLSPHPCGVHVRWTLIVRLRQHAHHAYQNLLDTLYGRPTLRGLFVVHGVVAGRVEDGDAYFAIRIHCMILVSATIRHLLCLMTLVATDKGIKGVRPNVPLGCHTSV